MEVVVTQGHPDFLDLPWGVPLAEWTDPRLAKLAHGMSRHVVRFVRYDRRAYALKATSVDAARREYRVLRDLHADHLPVVEPVGVVSDVPVAGEAVLITRYLDFSLPYWYLLGQSDAWIHERLLEAGVALLVRLHLDGVYWGDCSLSNVLWRRDAGTMMAYLVDAETTERHATIADAMRDHDLQIAMENVVGGLMELQARGRVRHDLDPVEVAEELRDRYESLWAELTGADEFPIDERWRIEQRVRRINELGFDVEELSISSDGDRLRVKPTLVDEGHHARDLRTRTGIDVQENQARRLLADIDGFGAWLERAEGRPVPQAVATARWMLEVYEPAVASIPPELGDHLEPVEVFHQFLEHRYLMAERLGRDVTNDEAMRSYVDSVLRPLPSERHLPLDLDGPVEATRAGRPRTSPREGYVRVMTDARRALARRAIGLIDLTDLADDHARDGIDLLCVRAAEHRTAAVCVWPEFVRRCVDNLGGSGVRVATVVNFPGGDDPTAEVLALTAAALTDGADDIDVVLPYRTFLAGDHASAGALLGEVAAVVHGGGGSGRVLKVILETGELVDDTTISEAARLAVDHGADFVKTSTGKTPVGATPAAAAAMLGVIAEAAAVGRTVGLKPSGGIRTLDDATTYLDLAAAAMGLDWATPTTFRFGASGLLDALLAELDDTDPPAPASTSY